MNDWLAHAFVLVCGQNPEHLWTPGGLALPCCQRCTGLYAGAVGALLLHWLCKPQPTVGWKWVHGMFLLQMVPFGFHWLPQGPVLRTETGVLFSFGLVAYLWLVFGEATSASPPSANGGDRNVAAPYGFCLLATLVIVPAVAGWGGRLGFFALSSLAALGALVLAGLAVVNIALLGRGGVRAAARRSGRRGRRPSEEPCPVLESNDGRDALGGSRDGLPHYPAA